MVEPFSEVGMIAQVSAIQLVMDKPMHASYDPAMLPDHLPGYAESYFGELG